MHMQIRFIIIAACVACQGRPELAESSQPAEPHVVDGILVQGGTLILPRADTVRASIVLERRESELRVLEIASETNYVTRDTLNVAGLYVHAADPLAGRVRVGDPGVLVVRAGPSSASPVAALIGTGTHPGWRSVAPTENAPSRAQDSHSGCYVAELLPWSDSAVAERIGWVPPTNLRLHWQYLWLRGAERHLTVTDTLGGSPLPGAIVQSWLPIARDSISIDLTNGYSGLHYRLARNAADLTGTLTTSTHTPGLPFARRAVHLRRRVCPNGRQ